MGFNIDANHTRLIQLFIDSKAIEKNGVEMKIYLDVCCLCRPFDDQTEEGSGWRLQQFRRLSVAVPMSLFW